MLADNSDQSAKSQSLAMRACECWVGWNGLVGSAAALWLYRWIVARIRRRYEQAVAAFGDGFDEDRMARVVVKSLPQFGDRARQDIIGDKSIAPHGANQFIFSYYFQGSFGQ